MVPPESGGTPAEAEGRDGAGEHLQVLTVVAGDSLVRGRAHVPPTSRLCWEGQHGCCALAEGKVASHVLGAVRKGNFKPGM